MRPSPSSPEPTRSRSHVPRRVRRLGPRARAGRLLAVLLPALLCAVPRLAVAQEVEVVLERFGVGSVYRPGDFAGIEVTLRDRRETASGDARNVLVQWEVVNPDGDVAEHVRLAGGLAPGAVRRAWLYAPLPPDVNEESIFRIRVFEETDGSRGRELGGARISPSMSGAAQGGSELDAVRSDYVEPRRALYAIFGTGELGLRGYQHVSSSRTGLPVATSHEDVFLRPGLRIEDLPDHRLGLEPFDLVVFSSDVTPGQLGARRAAALVEWVRGGGHLVLVLPPDVNPWGIGGGVASANELSGLLPQRAYATGDVALSEVLPIFSRASGIDGPRANAVLRGAAIFGDVNDPDAAVEPGWEPLVALPDGRVVAIERRLGHGRVTVIGLDLASNQLRGVPISARLPGAATALTMNLPEADVFWNPILGRRGDTPSPAVVEALGGDGRVRTGAVPEVVVGGAETILGDIEMAEDAEKGLLMALLLFVAYWFVAGPLGFLWLRSQGRVKQAWLGFAASAAIFTFLAWGGVGLIRKRETDVRHLTFLDHVYRPEVAPPDDPAWQRATSWMTLYLPGYGGETLSFADAADDLPGAQRQLHVRIPPGANNRPFPNAARYAVPAADDPDEIRLPSRSTTTIVRADWMGALDPAWGGLFDVDPDDPVRVEIGPDGRERPAGRITSRLPGRLANVMVLFVHSDRLSTAGYVLEDGREVARIPLNSSGEMSHNGDFVRVGGAAGLAPGASIGLGEIVGDGVRGNTRLAFNIDGSFVNAFEERSGAGGFGVNLQSRDERRRLQEMLSLFDQLTPPRWMRSAEGQSLDPTVRFARLVARDMDLSDWLSRPCVIVIGRLEDAALPIPLEAGGDPLEGAGDVIVRWIHPLPQIPERAFDDVMLDVQAPAGADETATEPVAGDPAGDDG